MLYLCYAISCYNAFSYLIEYCIYVMLYDAMLWCMVKYQNVKIKKFQ